MARHLKQVERESDTVPSRRSFFGRGVYGREGRRIGVLHAARAGRPGGNKPYAIVELASFSRNVSDLRAIPLSCLRYDDDRGHFLCDMSELSVRSAPVCSGAADWLDDRWTNRLDDYYDAVRH
jgi:hypothetical protein